MIRIIFDYNIKRRVGIIKSEYLNNIRTNFSQLDELANIKKRKNENIPSFKCVITPTGSFNVGLFPDILKYIISTKTPYKLIVTQPLKNAFFCGYKYDKIYELNLSLYDYQRESIIECLNNGRGIVNVGTGGGKTLTMATLVNTIRKISDKSHKTLIIVPSIQLVEQTYSDFIEYGINKFDISKWSGDNVKQDTPIIIASSSIINSKLTKQKDFIDVDLLIVDECHKVKKPSVTYNKINRIKTNNRIGFTGSLPDDKIDLWNIIGQFGKILYNKPSKSLRDEKYISDAEIHIVRINYKNKPIYETSKVIQTKYGETTKNHKTSPTFKYKNEMEFINNNKYRNNIIRKIATNVDNNVLILIERIKHGELLYSYIKDKCKNKKVFFIYGDIEVHVREKIKEILENNDDVICIAMSSIFSTGINIKNLHYIIFGYIGKAKTKIIQSIGRGLRKHKNKIKLHVYDICDNLEYSTKHMFKRMEIYKKEKLKYVIKEINEK